LDVNAALQAAALHLRAGRAEQAARSYEEAWRADPTNGVVALALGALLAQLGRLDAALELLGRAAQLLPENADAWLALGNVLVRKNAMADAALAFGKAAELRPDSAAAQNNLGNALRRLNRLEDAVASFRRAIALEPGSAQARYNLGKALDEAGELERAASAYEDALDVEPGLLAARSNLGEVRRRQRRLEEAVRRFQEVAAADPAFPMAFHNLGVALQESDELGAASEAYRRAIAQAPRELAAYNNLCITLLKLGKAEEALDVCERYLEASPANRKPLAYKAAALLELGRRDEARALLDFDRLVLRRRVGAPSGFETVRAFNDALAGYVTRHPTLAFEPHDKSTRGGSQSGELIQNDEPIAVYLKAMIVDAVTVYMRQLQATLPAHPYVAHLPRRWRLATWAVVLRSQGHQGPHFHPDGYVSGVYYVSLPSSIKAGAGDSGSIEFGRTAESIGGTQAPLVELIRPEEGLMLLFPSYFYHRTLPFEGDEPRVSVAFDVLPGDDGGGFARSYRPIQGTP
jgi:tetratricopeptide (TPR) repeat protein